VFKYIGHLLQTARSSKMFRTTSL